MTWVASGLTAAEIAAMGATAATTAATAATPALAAGAGALGAEAAAAGGTALATGAAEAAGAAGTAAGAAPAAINPATTMAVGNAAPGGYASILQPLGQAPASFTPTAGAAGEVGAGIQIPAGSTVNGQLLQGGMSVPQAGTTVNGAAAGGNMSVAPGAQVFTSNGAGGAADILAKVAATPGSGAASLKPEQVAQLNKLMNNQDQRNTAPPAAPAPGSVAGKGNISPASLNTPSLSTNRASLAQILGIK